MNLMIPALISVLAAQSEPIAIVGARIELGDGRTLASGTVVVRDGKIVAVGDVPVPSGAKVVDGNNGVLTPGLIDVTSLTGLAEVELEARTIEHQSEHPTPAFRPALAFNHRSPRVAIDRSEGITTVVVSANGSALSGQSDALLLNGEPVMLATSPIALNASLRTRQDGNKASVLLLWQGVLDDARTFHQNAAAFDRGDMRASVLTRQHLAALDAAVTQKTPWIVEADREADIRMLLAFAQKNQLSLIIRGGAEAWRCSKELAQNKVPVIVTASLGEPATFDALNARDDNATLLAAAGVEVIIAGGNPNGTSRLRHEAGLATAFGLPRTQSLASITLVPARALGLTDRGSIAVGKRADVVLWNGDPLETQTQATWMAIGGVPQDLATRQRALAKRYKERLDVRTQTGAH